MNKKEKKSIPTAPIPTTIKVNPFQKDILEDIKKQVFPLEQEEIIKKVPFWRTYFFALWNIKARRAYANFIKNPPRRVGVRMEMNNGHHAIFGIYEISGGFTYRDKKYLFDIENKYWVIGLNMFFYDFHEDICLPIKREIPSNEVKTALEQSDISEVAYAINPATLERFERSKIAEGIMKGQSIDDRMNLLTILIALNIILTVGVFAVVAWKLGLVPSGG